MTWRIARKPAADFDGLVCTAISTVSHAKNWPAGKWEVNEIGSHQEFSMLPLSMPLMNWLAPLTEEKAVAVDSSKTLIEKIKNSQKDRKKSGYKGPAKSPAAISQFVKPKLAWICPLDLLHSIGRITTPIVPNLVDLSSTWAIYRYIWAFAHNSATLSLSQIATEIDFHQKGLLSDEIGIGMAYWLMTNYFGVTTPPIDADIALRNTAYVAGPGFPNVSREKGTLSIPDYLFVLPNGKYAIVECKGTQSSKGTAINQIRRGLEQVPSITFPKGHKAQELVIATLITETKTEIYVVDPPPEDVDRDENLREHFTITDQELFNSLIKRLQAANLLAFAGAEGLAADIARIDVVLQQLRQEPPDNIQIMEVDSEFYGYSSVLPIRGQNRVQVSIFCGLNHQIYDYIAQRDFLGGAPSFWPEPRYWDSLRNRKDQGARHMLAISADNQESFYSFSRDGTVLRLSLS